jgi:GDPmannose 4,6-dehydratase
MTDRVALITGVTGQDGALLAQLLLSKGYLVHGLRRRTSLLHAGRLAPLISDPVFASRFFLHFGDMGDAGSLQRVLQDTQPTEIYNLAAQSDVRVSFEMPEYTADVDALGPLRLLEAIRQSDFANRVRFYQASTSELFGTAPAPQNERTPFEPRSPYAVAKLYAYWSTVNYREAYGLHASNGILFNHEGPTRGENFVTRKISLAVAAIAAGSLDTLLLGNLDARRDWGHARDYVEGMWRILQQPAADDYVMATGQSHSVREFVELAFRQIGEDIEWHGTGLDERGIDRVTGRLRVEIDPKYFRPHDVGFLLGDSSKAQEKLGWRHTVSFEDLVAEMVQADCQALGVRGIPVGRAS